MAALVRTHATSPSTERLVIVGGFLVGAICGFGGSILDEGSVRNVLYAISSVGLVVASAVLAVLEIRAGRVLTAAGFGLFAMAEVVLWAGGPSQSSTHEASFATAAMYYLPALLLVALANGFPIWLRVITALAAVPFGVHALHFITGGNPSPEGGWAAAGYAILAIVSIGWAASVWRREPSPIA